MRTDTQRTRQMPDAMLQSLLNGATAKCYSLMAVAEQGGDRPLDQNFNFAHQDLLLQAWQETSERRKLTYNNVLDMITASQMSLNMALDDHECTVELKSFHSARNRLVGNGFVGFAEPPSEDGTISNSTQEASQTIKDLGGGQYRYNVPDTDIAILIKTYSGEMDRRRSQDLLQKAANKARKYNPETTIDSHFVEDNAGYEVLVRPSITRATVPLRYKHIQYLISGLRAAFYSLGYLKSEFDIVEVMEPGEEGEFNIELGRGMIGNLGEAALSSIGSLTGYNNTAGDLGLANNSVATA